MEVLARSREESSETKLLEINQDLCDTPSSFIDHTSIYDCVVSTSTTPLLDEIRRGYSLMCSIRKAGEIALKRAAGENTNEKDIRFKDLILTPVAYSLVIPHALIAIDGVRELANLAFDEFRSLDDKYKELIVSSSFALINFLESLYRACNYFPDDIEVALPSYTTYFKKENWEIFFNKCPDDIDKSNLIRAMESSLAGTTNIGRRQFEITKPTDFEFLALFGLAFWSDKLLDTNETLLKIANGYRSEITRELHCYYTRRGTIDYASRLGNIFCLLVTCQNHSEKKLEDFEVYRLLNMYKGTFSKE